LEKTAKKDLISATSGLLADKLCAKRMVPETVDHFFLRLP
jgi:hypothetical protein